MEGLLARVMMDEAIRPAGFFNLDAIVSLLARVGGTTLQRELLLMNLSPMQFRKVRLPK